MRFLPVRNDMPADRPWLLRVESEDGLLAGRTVVTSAVPGEPVAIRLVPTARLDIVVKVKGPRDLFYYPGPTIAIEPLESGELEDLIQRDVVRFADDRIEFHYRRTALAAGKVRVLLRELDGYEPRATATLVAGKAQTCEIELEFEELPAGAGD